MREVHFCFQRFCYCLMLTELSTIIKRDRVTDIFIATESIEMMVHIRMRSIREIVIGIDARPRSGILSSLH